MVVSSLCGLEAAICSLKCESSVRAFRCANCHVRCRICTRCDRGQRTCSEKCRKERELQLQRERNRRHQQTANGRRNNSARQKRFRNRDLFTVTYGGSSPPHTEGEHPHSDELSVREVTSPMLAPQFEEFIDESLDQSESPNLLCSFCGEPCSPFERLDFLYSSAS